MARAPRKPTTIPVHKKWTKLGDLPKDRPFLIRGTWKADKAAGLKGGGPIVVVATFESGDWQTSSISTLTQINADWQEWMDIPE